MAFKMTHPTIKGSPVHKASIAKAKYVNQPTVSQSRTTADPSLVYAGDEYGKSLVPEAVDFRIKHPKITYDKTKKDLKETKDAIVNNKDDNETTTVATSGGTPVVITGDEDIIVDQSYLDNLPLPAREEGSFGDDDYAGMELPEEEFADPTIQASLNTQTPSITSSVAPPTVSGSDMLRAEILNYDGTSNNLPRNQVKVVSLPPLETPSASNVSEQTQLTGSMTPPPETKPDNTPLAEDNPKYALYDMSSPEFRHIQDNRVRISDTEGYGLINNDGDIIITYNGYKVDRYEEIPSDIFNDMAESINEETDEQGRPTQHINIINDPNVESETSTDVNNSELPVINNSEESQTVVGPREATDEEKQDASKEIVDRGLEPIPEEGEEETIIYEKPSRFDYPIDMDEPSKGKINPKTKGISYNEALRLYEEQQKNNAIQQRTQSIFRNAVPGGKVQTKLKEEGFNPYKSI
jgi:hypothetical protein